MKIEKHIFREHIFLFFFDWFIENVSVVGAELDKSIKFLVAQVFQSLSVLLLLPDGSYDTVMIDVGQAQTVHRRGINELIQSHSNDKNCEYLQKIYLSDETLIKTSALTKTLTMFIF